MASRVLPRREFREIAAPGAHRKPSTHTRTRQGPANCALIPVSPTAISDNRGDVNQPKEPKDATKSTEEQRQLQEQLEHQDDDPDAPGLHQSQRNTPDESTR
jgi:hypothetical protein